MSYVNVGAAMLRVDDMSAAGSAGLPPCATVLTLDGALPIDHLYTGDRLITRKGACEVTGIERMTLPAGSRIVTIRKDALGGRPDRDMWLPAGQKVLLRDWRAKALYGQAQACVPVAQLVDGEFLRLEETTETRELFALSFGRPEILYADGLELASYDEARVLA